MGQMSVVEIAAQETTLNVQSRVRLRSIIEAKSLLKDAEFHLASGRDSKYYFDMKPTMLDPEGATFVADLVLDYVHSCGVNYIGGLAVGAVPIVSQVVLRSFGRGEVSGFYVRDEKKTHGTKALMYGNLPADPNGQPVIICDDVTTTGGSVIQAVDAVREAGFTVHSIITIVDRLEGAGDNLRDIGLSLFALYTSNDFRI